MTSSKSIVEQWLKAQGIVPRGFLLKDLQHGNNAVLDLIAFAVQEYPNLRGLGKIVKEFGRLDEMTNETEQVCENLLTELLALRFVTEVLRERVVELEALSPDRIDAKRCDLKTVSGNDRATYYDVKDLSIEILSQIPDDEFPGLAVFDPVLPDRIRPWIKDKVDSCIGKGANYLIASLPVWHAKSVRGLPRLREAWVKGIYPNYEVLSPSKFKVSQNNVVPQFFRGIYVIRREEHLLLEF